MERRTGRTGGHEPDEESREAVAVLAAAGTPQAVIARLLKVSEPTLRKHYRKELDDGLAIANAQVAQTLFRMARSGRVPAATFFWLKTRAGWRETDNLELSGTVAVAPVLSDDRLLEEASAIVERRKRNLDLVRPVGGSGLPELSGPDVQE
jgi:hypothetical protein